MDIQNTSNATGGQFATLINNPQSYTNDNTSPILNYEPDTFENSAKEEQEEEKSSFGKNLFKTLIVVAGLIGLNRFAHHKGWIGVVNKNASGFANKYIKKPLNNLDNFIVKLFGKETEKTITKEEIKP